MPGLLSLVIALALIGFVLWLVVTYVPMPEPFKRVILVVVVLVLLLYLLRIVLGGSALPLLS